MKLSITPIVVSWIVGRREQQHFPEGLLCDQIHLLMLCTMLQVTLGRRQCCRCGKKRSFMCRVHKVRACLNSSHGSRSCSTQKVDGHFLLCYRDTNSSVHRHRNQTLSEKKEFSPVSYARAASSAVSKVPSHFLSFVLGSLISAAYRPHGRCRTPLYLPSWTFLALLMLADFGFCETDRERPSASGTRVWWLLRGSTIAWWVDCLPWAPAIDACTLPTILRRLSQALACLPPQIDLNPLLLKFAS